MNNVLGFVCVECSRTFSISEVEYVCPGCDGNLDIVYDYDRIGKRFTKQSLAANRDLTMWRYGALLPIAETAAVPPLAPGWTPVYDCPRLAHE